MFVCSFADRPEAQVGPHLEVDSLIPLNQSVRKDLPQLVLFSSYFKLSPHPFPSLIASWAL